MKKYLSFLTFAFMAVISLTLASCGGDDYEDVAESTIVGTWEVTDIDFPYDNGELIGEVEIGNNNKLTFRSDGTYVLSDVDNGKWKKEGNKLTMTSDVIYPLLPSVYIITKLNNSEMELMRNYETTLQVVIKLKKISSEALGGSTEMYYQTVGKITVNGDTYSQSPDPRDVVGLAFFLGTYTKCETGLYKSYPSNLGYYNLSFHVLDCVQGKEVELSNIHFHEFNTSGSSRCDFESGKIVCTKKTSTKLELKFYNVKITNHFEDISYTLNGTLVFDIE